MTNKRIQREVNDVLTNRNRLDAEDNELAKQNAQVLERVLTARNDINSKIQIQLERVKALEKGGQQELARLIERQKVEAQISQLMKDGQLTREEATNHVTKLLELENQEKALVEQLKVEEQEREQAKKKLSENNKLVLQLQEEKKFAEEIKAIEEAIHTARLVGNQAEADALAQKKINLIANQEELANRDAVKNKLQLELADLQAKRDVQDKELKILDLIAQGREKEANELQKALDIQKQVQQIQEQLEIGEKEAMNRVGQRAKLEKDIQLNKIEQEKQQLRNNAVNEIANKDMRDAVDANEKSRIRAGKAVISLDKKILKLRERGDDRAKEKLKNLNKLKNEKWKLSWMMKPRKTWQI